MSSSSSPPTVTSSLTINNPIKQILATHDTDHIEYVAGLSAAMVSVVVTFPINKLMFRQSLWGFELMTALRQLKIEGLQYLYRGVGPPIIIKSINASIMFGSFNQYHHFLESSTYLKEYPLSSVFCSSMMSGCSEALLTPLERIQMILQDGRHNNVYANTFDALIKLRYFGIKEYYRGLTAVLTRNGPGTFLYFGFVDKLKDILRPAGETSEHGEVIRNFLAGASLGAVISTAFYPLNVVRIHMQIQEVGTEHISIVEAARRLYNLREGNARMLLSGIHTNVFRSFFYWGCITVFSEVFRKYMIHNNN